ncbi:MAG: 30S ribosomal protein S20 [Patescibacteria group bacterium]
MPITKSAKKSLAVSETKRAHNLILEKKFKKALKTVTKENVSEVISLVDKTAKTNIIHKNKAARIKSRLTKKFGTDKVTKKAAPKVATKETVKKPTTKTTKPKTSSKK